MAQPVSFSAALKTALSRPRAPAPVPSPGGALAFDPAHPDARAATTVSGGLYGEPLRRYISSRSQQLGLDPNVALAVAPHEGGFAGAIGDQGTSFGPFQLHRGGALPASVTNPQAWANSQAGVDYALGQIASTLRGRRGETGVEAVVREFERPAAQYVGGEVAKALATYRSLGSAAAPQMLGFGEALKRALAGGSPQVSTLPYDKGAPTPQASTLPYAGGKVSFSEALRAALQGKAAPTSDTSRLQLQGSTLQGVDPELVRHVNELGEYLGKDITVTSGFRDRAKQAALYQRYVDSGFDRSKIAARAGLSNHEFGRALDLVINGVPIASAVPAATLRRFGLHNPVSGDLPHTTLLGISG